MIVPTGDYDLQPLFPNLNTGTATQPNSPIMVRRVRMPGTASDPARPGKLLPGPWVWFVALRSGRIFAMNDPNAAAPPAANLRNGIFSRPELGESGLLGLAFDPDLGDDPTRAHVYLVESEYARVSVKRFTVVTTPDGRGGYTYSSRDEVEILRAWGGSHHFGGEAQFGADGFLYVSVGDDDALAHTQSPRMLLPTTRCCSCA